MTRGKGEQGYGWKEGEGNSQELCMNDPWTWTTGWRLTVVAEIGGALESNGKGRGLRQL